MPSRGLPENIDTSYADDTAAPDVKLHQQHHDVIHDFVNTFDSTVAVNGDTLFWNSSTGLWYPDAPASGGVGSDGIQGRGFRWRGPWSSATAYFTYNGTSHLEYDVVNQDGASWVCLTDHTNSQPPSANWDLMADKGADGATGVDGTSGVNGLKGLGNFYIQQDGLAIETVDSLPLVVPVDMDIVAVTPVSTQPPASVDVVLDLFLNTTTVYTGATKPTIPVGELVGVTTTPNIVTLDAGDILSANITQAGSEDGTAAAPTIATTTGTTSSGASTASSFAINEPAAAHATGDLIACAFVYGTFSINSIPTGWVDLLTGSTTVTPIDGNPTTAYHMGLICWEDDGTAWGTKTVTLSGSGPLLSCTFVLKDAAAQSNLVDDSDVVNSGNTGTGTSIVLPAVDTNQDDEIIFYIYAIKQISGQGPEAPTLPAGTTTVFSGNTTRAAAVNVGMRIAKLAAPTAGTYAAKTAGTTGQAYHVGRVITGTGGGTGGAYPGYDVALQITTRER